LKFFTKVINWILSGLKKENPLIYVNGFFLININSGRHLLTDPVMRDITNKTRKIKNKTLAIPAAPDAIPPNPKIAATMAMIRNVTVHRSIVIVLNSTYPHHEEINAMLNSNRFVFKY
jgi:hypothetical protein